MLRMVNFKLKQNPSVGFEVFQNQKSSKQLKIAFRPFPRLVLLDGCYFFP